VELTRFDDIGAFLDDVEPTLLVHEAEHALLLGAALALRAEGRGRAAGLVPYAAVVRDHDGVALAALLAASRPLCLATDRADVGAAVDRLVGDLRRGGTRPESVHGRVGVAFRFASAWETATSAGCRLLMRQRLHALTEVRPVPLCPGGLRPATAVDLPLLSEWMVDFDREALGDALGEADVERTRAGAARRFAAGELFVWDDGGPCSMAATARPTRGTIAVNAVYTPPQRRGRGYATACVARLGERLLAEGRQACVLFTDLTNPTSNAIYARIGYRAVADFELYGLDG
jgi:GNAT superfamily N-acetyltransferase